jgi:hypothetical protein
MKPSPQQTVRLQLPPGIGRSVSARGFAFEADVDGVLTVPREVAAELEQHWAAAPAGTPSGSAHSYAEELKKIGAIDARLRELYAEKARFEVGVKRADEMGAGAGGASVAAAAEEFQVKRRRTIADMLLGLAKRADVDAIEAQRKQAEARLAEEAQTREMAALGVTELREQHIWPLEREAAELGVKRSLAVRRALRARAEAAAVEYRNFMHAQARAFGVVQAYAVLLADLERVGTGREDTQGGRQSFDCFNGNQVGPLPVCPALEAFKGSPFEITVPFDVAEIRAQVRQQLISDGLLS